MSQDAPSGRTYAGQPVEHRQRQRRARFLESGLTVFARDGYASSSVGAICKEAGLSSRQFYEEFSGREALMLELYEKIDSEARDAVMTALAAHEGNSGLEIVDAATRAYMESMGTDVRRARVALVEVIGATPKVEARRVEYIHGWGSALAGAVEAAVKQGEAPPGPNDIRVIAVIGAVNYVLYGWSLSERRQPLDEVIESLRRILTGLLLA